MDRSLPRPTELGPLSAGSVVPAASASGQLEPARGATLLGVVAAVAVHAAIIVLSPREAAHAALSAQPVEMEIFEAPRPVAEPEPEPPQAPVAAMIAPVERRRAPEPVREPKREATQAPKAAEEAAPPPAVAATPAQAEKPSEPAPALVAAADAAGDASHSIVQSATGAMGGRGTAGSGVVGGTGTGIGPVGSKTGVVGGTGSGSAVPVTLSSKAWRCPWPEDAEYEDFDQQAVSIRVVVAEDGRVEKVEILRDPGFGFGRAARDCARKVRFNPAKDASGRSIRAVSPPINVHFVR